jgi:hypothetical protein
MSDTNKHPTVYRFSVDNKPFEQRDPFITGAQIKALVCAELWSCCGSFQERSLRSSRSPTIPHLTACHPGK